MGFDLLYSAVYMTLHIAVYLYLGFCSVGVIRVELGMREMQECPPSSCKKGAFSSIASSPSTASTSLSSLQHASGEALRRAHHRLSALLQLWVMITLVELCSCVGADRLTLFPELKLMGMILLAIAPPYTQAQIFETVCKPVIAPIHRQIRSGAFPSKLRRVLYA